MKCLPLDHIWVHPDSTHSPMLERFKADFPETPVTLNFVGAKTLDPKSHDIAASIDVRRELTADEFSRSKREIWLKPHEGQFFKRCPGSRPGLACCNYFVLNLGQQCPFNCTYCYLQSFLNSGLMHIYTNIDQAIRELEHLAHDLKGQTLRVGTGEVIDSLAWDPWTHAHMELIEFFAKQPTWKLELKTKSNYVDHLIDGRLQPANNIVFSWSINAPQVAASEELDTSTLFARLTAARRVRDYGFNIAFHIDPMIYHPDWQTDYAELISMITDNFNPAEVDVISIGSLRFQPEQKHLMRERFGYHHLIHQGELMKSTDGKLRYPVFLRTQMYQHVEKLLKQHSSQWRSFLCMEAPEVWLSSRDQLPKGHTELAEFYNFGNVRKLNSKRQQQEHGKIEQPTN